ncbi:MAG: T9SS type A sorting domain-containing protein [Ignavibacteriota bacterium]
MKKVILLILVMVSLSGTLFSQTFSFYRTSPLLINGDTSYSNATISKAVYKNTGSTSLNFTFARILNNLPGPDWSCSMCAGTNCFSPTQDTIPPRGASNITLGAGVADTLSIDFYGISIGTATVIIKVWVNSNPAVYVIDTFKVHLGPVGIRQISSIVEGYKLEQNYPNPFNPSTRINFSVPKRESVSLKVYDILGNEKATLLNSENLSQGTYSYDFNSSEFNMSSGVYYYILKTESFTSAKKMMLIK